MATRKKRQNPFITFMGTFRKQNKGKYDFKQMGREAGKAWHKVKGGGKNCEELEVAKKAFEYTKDSDALKEAFVKCAAERRIVGDRNNGNFTNGGGGRRTQKRRR